MSPGDTPRGEDDRTNDQDSTTGGALAAAVAAAFAADGPLAAAPGYLPRAEQLRLALAVAQAIEQRQSLVAEAGTGVGKTFAYLVPLLLSGGRALVSTATKSLQDQLFLRDLPRLRDALKLPATVALLKGRGSYLCLHRLGLARHEPSLANAYGERALARIERWAQHTSSGDLAELEGLDERSPMVPLVTSTRDNCLGTECPQFRQCHLVRARRDAMAADLVVVNHHLFFADLALRDAGVGELLPSVDAVVFDEAHQLVEVGVQFLGSMLGSAQLIDFARDLRAYGLGQAGGHSGAPSPWSPLADACEQAARELRLAVAHAEGRSEPRGAQRLPWRDELLLVPEAVAPSHAAAAAQVIAAAAGDAAPDHRSHAELDALLDAPPAPALPAVLAALQAALRGAVAAIAQHGDGSPDLQRLHERALQLADHAARFTRPADAARVRWIDLSPQQARLVDAPLDLRESLGALRTALPRAWVFTSATLGDDERLSWFAEPAGLDDATRLRVGSPFDSAAHARLWIPTRMPRPDEPGHAAAVGRLAAQCAHALGGRSFVLTTTLRALPRIADSLRDGLRRLGSEVQVLVQGDEPKRALLQRFLAEPASVLVGSASFWEGIDAPGDALQCVLIDKLPFPPPNDPLVQARMKRLEDEGRSPFQALFVAQAAVALKQGVGRLIRSEHDRGLVVVCDMRMAAPPIGKPYGRRLRDALPPMTPIETKQQALAWLHELAAARDVALP